MSLSNPVPRRHVNTRTILCEGYRREDGLLDIEASMVDTKARAYREALRGVRQPHEPVHEMHLRLTVAKDMFVRHIEVTTVSAPFPACSETSFDYSRLVGQSLAKGWRRAVLECLGGVNGCTHVRDLLVSAATSAFQTFYSWPDAEQPASPLRRPDGGRDRARFIDGCRGWAADGLAVATFYPQLHRKPD
jgi:hypothetical protein